MIGKFFSARRGIFTILAVLAVSFLLMTSGLRSAPEATLVERAVAFVLSPLQSVTSSLIGALERVGDFFFAWRRLGGENRELRDEVARLSRALEERREQGLAFERLADMLDFRLRRGQAMTSASVVGRDASNYFKTIVINKGSKDGVPPNAAVVTPTGVVGRVIELFPRSARVLLITDRSSGVDAVVQRTRDQGVIQGYAVDKCEMKYLPRQARVQEGDVVITSGMAGVFPKGIRIGEVSAVTRGGYLLQKVEITPAVEMDRLEEVMVMRPQEEEGGGMKPWWTYLAALLAVVVMQSISGLHFQVKHLSPDFFLLAVLVFAMRRGSAEGTAAGMVLGGVQDCLSASLAGTNVLTKGLTGFAVGAFRERVDFSNPNSQSLAAFLATLLEGLLLTTVLVMIRGLDEVLHSFVAITLPLAFFHGLLLPLLAPAARTAGEMWAALGRRMEDPEG